MEVHRCRFVSHVPSAVVDVSVTSRYCGVLRSNSSIDLYETQSWVLVLSFPGLEAYGFKKIRWMDEQTFITCGTSGTVCVWSLSSLVPLMETSVPGSGLWSLAVTHGHSVALACDDGIVRIYELGDDLSFTLTKAFHKQPCKMLDVLWDSPDEILSCGSDGGIYKWSPRLSTCQLRIANTACVWTLKSLPQDQVASGDSEGNVKIWETQFGTMIAAFSTHEADVLTLAVLNDCLYAAGVDSKVVKLKAVAGTWRVVGKCRGQSHDIRALASVGNLLVSGGVTTDLCLYPQDVFESEGEAVLVRSDVVQYKPKPYRHISALRLANYGGVGEQSNGRVVLTHHTNSLTEVWIIDQSIGEVVKIAKIQAKAQELVTASDVSPNGKFLCYSTISYTRLFKIVGKDDPRLESLTLSAGAVVSKFALKGLYLGYTSLRYIDTETLSEQLLDSYPSILTHLSVRGPICAVRLFNNSIKVYKDFQLKFALPQLEETVTAIGLSYAKSLYISTASNLLFGFSLKTMELDSFSKQYSSRLPKNFLGEFHKVIGIHFFEGRKNLMLLNTHYSFTWVDLTRPPPRKCEVVPKKRFADAVQSWSGLLSTHPLHCTKPCTEAMEVDGDQVQNFAINKRFGPVLLFQSLSDSVCLVELPWEDALSHMPQPLAVHKYGS